MFVFNRSLAATMCLLLAACGGKHGNAQPDGGTGTWAITLIGSANLTLHPGEKRVLQVVLAQDQVGPVAGAQIHFEFQDGDPAGAQLETYDVQTDTSGIATAHFTAGSTANSRPTFKLVASTSHLDAQPVAFSFNVIPVRRLLQIVGGATTHVSSDGQSATASMFVSSNNGLKVRELDQDTGAPIAGDTLNFSLPAIAKSAWSGSTTRSIGAQTNSGGEAQVFLVSTASTEGPFLVVGQSAGGGAVNFTVTVSAFASSQCTNSQQCKPGQVCINGTCQDSGGGGQCGGGADNPCPFGYTCVNGTCQPPANTSCDPSAPNCGSGQCCDPGSTQCKDICPAPCAAGQTCVAGATCGTGTCQNNPEVTPDVSGVWITKHIFSIRDALPTTVQGIFTALRLLDQALLGKLTIPGLPQWLVDIINKALSRLLKQYIPAWVQTVIQIGDDLSTILSNLRSEGSMRLVNGIDQAHVKGTEVWTSLVFYWLPLCNGNIQGDPDVPPECARIDLATTDSQNPGDVGQCHGQALPSITVQAAPFTGNVSGTAAPFAFNVDQRRVNLKMGKVILVVIDYILALVTPYHCIDEATDCRKGQTCIVDCPQLGVDVSNLTNGFIDSGTAEGICDQVVTVAGQAVTTLLAKAWPITADVLDFNGHATVHVGTDATVCPSGVNCADRLGKDSYDLDLRKHVDRRDGYWSGDFFFKLLHKLPGAWEATRPGQ